MIFSVLKGRLADALPEGADKVGHVRKPDPRTDIPHALFAV
jgi:hypothetical protein